MNLLLKNHQSIGDVLMLTACVRDLKRWYPEINVMVDTSCNVLFEHNPYLAGAVPIGESVIDIKMEYPLIHKVSERDVHFLHGFIEYINEKLSLRVKLTEFKGDLHLSEKEKTERIVQEPYWVMVAGGKNDFTAKHWWQEAWQTVIDKSNVKFVTIGGKEHLDTHCTGLNGVVNMQGKTSIREALQLIYHSEGVISPVTFAMHTAAIFDKPCVVIAGGREHWWWEKYPGHVFIHTQGSLDCCRAGGCWKNNCDNKDANNHQKCLAMIDPAKVAEIINKISEVKHGS
ncbi:MAG: glycosyltransferase family 9 protein [Smithella sp.]|jgi:ADP-heptose:LPS heptosyltransferase